jgi:hypothetical protein
MGTTRGLTTLFAAVLVLAASAAAAWANDGAMVIRSSVVGEQVVCDSSPILTITAGLFQFVVHETQTSSGAFHVDLAGNAQGIQAVNEVTGAKYLIPGGFSMEMNVTPGATVSNDTGVIRVIGQGGAPNFTSGGVVHTTVDANGNVTASVDHFTMGSCT